MQTTVFTSGGSQAVRIPKEFRLETKKVEIERKGGTLVLRPIADETAWPEGYFEFFAKNRLDDDFIRHSQGEHRDIQF